MVLRLLFALTLVACNAPRSTLPPADERRGDDDPSDLDLCFDNGDCPEGQGCLLGSGCRELICVPGQDAACLDEHTARACHASGTYFEDVTCGAGKTCDNGAPLDCLSTLVCLPESTRCVDEVQTEVCNAEGSAWEPGPACVSDALGRACTEGACRTACEAAEAGWSSLGCSYVGVDLANYVVSQADLGKFAFGFVVVNPHAGLSATVQVKDEDSVLQTKSIAAGERGVFTFPLRDRHNAGTGLRKLAYRIVSDLPVAVYQLNPIETADYNEAGDVTALAVATEASLLLPLHALDTRYVALGWQQTLGPSMTYTGGSLLAVVAVDTAVDVTVTPRAVVTAAQGAPGFGEGEAKTVRLEPFEVLQLNTTLAGQDFSGTSIEATGKVAVFSGNVCARVPYGKKYCGHMEEQMLGLSAWDTAYVAAKSAARGDEKDYWRITAAEDDTVVYFHPSEVGASTALAKGESMIVSGTTDFLLTATRPVLVAQYFEGSEQVVAGCSGETCSEVGGPAMMLVPPVGQFQDHYVFVTPEAYQADYISIVLEDAATELFLDGELVTETPSLVGQSDFAVLRLPVGDGPHTLSGDHAFGVTVYGYGGNDSDADDNGTANVSYAYPAGLSALPLNPVPTEQ